MSKVIVPKGSYLVCPECDTKLAKIKDNLTYETRLNIDFFEPIGEQEMKPMKMVSCHGCGAYVNMRCVDNYKEEGQKVIITVEDIKIEVPVESGEDHIVAAAKKLFQAGITFERGLRESINFELRRG